MELVHAIGGILLGWVWLTYSIGIGIILAANWLTTKVVSRITHGEYKTGLPFVGKRISNLCNVSDMTAPLAFLIVIPSAISVLFLFIGMMCVIKPVPHHPSWTFSGWLRMSTFDWAYNVGYQYAGFILTITSIVSVIEGLRHGYPTFKKVKQVVDRVQK